MPVAEAVAVGQELPSLAKELTQRRIDVFSGVKPRSIHTDEDWARQKGFRTTLAQGMMSTAYVSELMTRLLGAGFVKGGTLSMAFTKPVYAGDRLTVHGAVKASSMSPSGITRSTIGLIRPWATSAIVSASSCLLLAREPTISSSLRTS